MAKSRLRVVPNFSSGLVRKNGGLLVVWAKSRHLAGLAILGPVHLGGKYPGPLPRCSWVTCKRGQSPRYLRSFRSSNNGKFSANAPLCPGRGRAGVYIDWCIKNKRYQKDQVMRSSISHNFPALKLWNEKSEAIVKINRVPKKTSI